MSLFLYPTTAWLVNQCPGIFFEILDSMLLQDTFALCKFDSSVGLEMGASQNNNQQNPAHRNYNNPLNSFFRAGLTVMFKYTVRACKYNMLTQ